MYKDQLPEQLPDDLLAKAENSGDSCYVVLDNGRLSVSVSMRRRRLKDMESD